MGFLKIRKALFYFFSNHTYKHRDLKNRRFHKEDREKSKLQDDLSRPRKEEKRFLNMSKNQNPVL